MEDDSNSISGLDLRLHSLSSSERRANKKRFSDEQIKFLERMFESESRPESRMKQQLANHLGLQPRQVAIWFQNRRARLKTKLIERDYNNLKLSYEALAYKFESLKREHQSLQIQLQKLKNLHLKQHEKVKDELDRTESNRNIDSESKEKISLWPGGSGHREVTTSIDHNNSISIESTGEETDMLDLAEQIDGTATSSDWHSFESTYLIDESTTSSQWWQFFS